MSLKVLIVDPDWYFFDRARALLESCGHHVLQEARPDLALRRAERWRPDLVMVNVDLPECCQGNLLALLAEVRPRPAILLVAALNRFEKAWHAWQRGGDEVLFKPLLHPSELHVAILAARENALSPRRRRPKAQPAVRSA